MTFFHPRLISGLPAVSCALLMVVASGLGLGAQAQTPTTGEPEATPDTPETEPEVTPEAPGETASRFTCQIHNGQYTVMYAPDSQPEQMYPWAVPQSMGSAWPAERRCQAISARLESYRPDGLLTLNTGVENGYNTVCVTTEAVPGCRIVFTVPPGQDPTLTRNQVFDNLASADQGQPTEGVNTFVGGSTGALGQLGDLLGFPSTGSRPTGNSQGINLKPFLAPMDGGTGAQLTGGSSRTTPTGRPLNPENFR